MTSPHATPVEPPNATPAEAPQAQPVEAPPAAAPPRSQAQFLADASRALSLGDASHALQLIDEDTRIHPGGALVEERDALRINALTTLGRDAEARVAARRLLAAYPNSIHRRLAERVLAKEKP